MTITGGRLPRGVIIGLARKTAPIHLFDSIEQEAASELGRA